MAPDDGMVQRLLETRVTGRLAMLFEATSPSRCSAIDEYQRGDRLLNTGTRFQFEHGEDR
jgi:hypothetical protein